MAQPTPFRRLKVSASRENPRQPWVRQRNQRQIPTFGFFSSSYVSTGVGRTPGLCVGCAAPCLTQE